MLSHGKQLTSLFARSLVESEHPVSKCDPEGTHTCDGPEATVIFGTPFPNVLVRTIAERGIRGQLAVAKFIVAGLSDIESHGPAPSQYPLALTVAHWVDLTVPARAPVVRLASAEEQMSRENTGI